jgi:hypothetical protein
MNSFEQVKIEQLPGKNNEKGLNQAQLKDYFDEKFFDDLKNNKVKIKQQWDLYIFEQNDINSSQISQDNKLIKKFYVEKKVLQDYLREEQKKAEVSLESDVLLKEFFETITVNKDLSWFQTEVISESVDMLDINNLINEYKKYLTYKKSDIINNSRDWRSTLRELQKEAEYRIKILEWIKADLWKSSNIDIYLRDINICKNDIDDFEHAKQKALLGENANVPRLLHDKKSIDKYNIELKNQTILAEKINKVLKNIAANKLFLNDQEWLREYLYAVYHGEIDPSSHPFYAKHQADFMILKAMDESLYKDIMTRRNKTKRINPWTYYMENGKIVRCTWSNISGGKSWSIEKSSSWIADKLEDMWWIKNEKQKEAVKKLGKFAMIWTAIFLWFKLFQTLFTKKWKDKEGNRDRWGAALYWWGLFALLNIDKVAWFGKELFNIWGEDKTINTRKTAESMGTTEEDVEIYIKPQYTTVATLWWVPINVLIERGFLTKKNWKFEIDHSSYKDYIESSNMRKDQKTLILENLEIIKDDNSILNNWLNSFWINSINDLKDVAWNNNGKTILDSDKTNEYINNITSGVNMKLNEEWFKAKNSKDWYNMTQEYNADNFGNYKLVEWMEKWWIKLSKNKNYTLNKMINKSEIDLENKTIKWFKNSAWNLIKFETYEEMFDAMQLTEFIRENFRWKTAVSPEPFHISLLWNIEFDNTNWYEVWKNETNVVNGNFYKNTLNNISPTLWQQKEDYKKYLNERWKTEWKSSS